MRLFLAMVVLSLTLGSEVIHAAGWTRTPGPNGGATFAILPGSTYYLGTQGGLYSSSDGGVNWSLAALSGKSVFALAQSGTNVFAAVGSTVYRFSEGAATVDSMWTFDQLVLSLAAVNGSVIAGLDVDAQGIGGGVYRTTDQGGTWTDVSNALMQDVEVGALVTSGSAVIAATWGRGVFRSADDGATWARADVGLPAARRTIWNAAASGSTLMICTDSAGVFASSDRGGTWRTVPTSGLQAGADLYAIAFIGQTLVVSTADDSLFVTTNNGTQWGAVANGFPQGWYVYTLAAATGRFYAGIDAGLHGSSDGVSWGSARSGESSASVYALHTFHSNLFAGGSAGIQWSTDGGSSWVDPRTADVTYDKQINAFTESNDTLYAGGEGFFQFDEASGQWKQLAPGSSIYIHAIAAVGNTWYAAAGYDGVGLSTDGGRSWVFPDVNLPPLDSARVTALFATDQAVYAGVTYDGSLALPNVGGVWRSSDFGISWSYSNNGIPFAAQPVSITHIDGKFYVGTTGGLYGSADGASWTLVSAVPTSGSVFADSVYGAVTALSIGNGIFYSQNSGVTWQSANLGLTDLATDVLAVVQQDAFVGTWHTGVWRRPRSEFATSVGERQDVHLSSEVVLESCYPDPFVHGSGIVRIEFTVKTSRQVSLDVVDVLGRRVGVPVDRAVGEGRHVATFDPTPLAAGVYRCVVTGNGQRVSRAFIVR